MIRLGTDFFPPNIKAFVSDINCDFRLAEPFVGLTIHQQLYLKPFGLEDSPRWIHLRQTHGNKFMVMDENRMAAGLRIYDADAAVTDLKHVPVSIRTADCQALFIYAPDIETVAVVHAGWKGTQQKIVEEVLRHLTETRRANAEFIKVMFGPSIRACCYEVNEDVSSLFQNFVTYREGVKYLDLVAANRAQLKGYGVREQNIRDYGVCTFCHPQFYSYRRQGEKSGRMINVMVKE